MKRLFMFALAAALFLSLCACGRLDIIATASGPTETTCPAETVLPPEETAPEFVFSYGLLEYTDFLLSSGAGGWGTTLYIEGDGSFSGIYHDSEMGNSGPDYPHGTVYYCAFSGQLGTPEQLGSHTYKLPILTLQYTQTPDTQEIKGQQRYCYTSAFGLEGTRELLLYLPGAPLDQLPMEYRQWVWLGEESSEVFLPFYGLYNQPEQFGFSSINRMDWIRSRVQEVEHADPVLQASVEQALTQTDMNILTQQRYEMWDGLLNELWGILKQTMDPDAFTALTREQLDWIREKEQAASDAAGEYEGGSLAPLVWSTTAADLTKDRVYCLLTYLPE